MPEVRFPRIRLLGHPGVMDPPGGGGGLGKKTEAALCIAQRGKGSHNNAERS